MGPCKDCGKWGRDCHCHDKQGGTMSNTKHTEGAARAERLIKRRILELNLDDGVNFHDAGTYADIIDRETNASELLAACKGAANWLLKAGIIGSTFNALESAIAKAEGR